MRSLVTIVSLVAVPSLASAQPAPRDTAAVRRDLIAIENEIARANRDCDYKYFARIEAPEFIFTGANGALTTRAEDLAGEKDCRKSVSTTAFDEVRLLSYQGFVVLNARQTVSGTANGQPYTRKSRFTDVFVWREGRWQIVSGHSSRIP